MKLSRILFLASSFFLFFFILSGVLPVFSAESGSETSGISAEEFIQSKASVYFQEGNYDLALKAMDDLLQKYPGDSLLLRYRAMALDRSGRSEEAIAIFKSILEKDPEHAPTKYFLGQAYEKTGKHDLAIKEWEWVRDHAQDSPYGAWADESLKLAMAGKEPVEIVKPRWRISARYGYEGDSNVSLKPSDKNFASSEDASAGRHTFDAIFRYNAYTRRDLIVDAIYTARQSLHDSGLSEFNFTSQEFALDLRKRTNAFGRDFIFGVRYDLLGGFLDGETFSLKNRVTLEADTRFSAQTRTVASYQYTAANFGPDGADPSISSRDGSYHDVGVTQYWYSEDFKQYISLLGEFNAGDTRGDNFNFIGGTTRAAVHTPVFWRTDLDVSVGFQYEDYPDFVSLSSLDTDQRRDYRYDTLASLTHYLTRDIAIRVFYRYINTQNDNSFYEYDRHIGGGQVVFSKSF